MINEDSKDLTLKRITVFNETGISVYHDEDIWESDKGYFIIGDKHHCNWVQAYIPNRLEVSIKEVPNPFLNE